MRVVVTGGAGFLGSHLCDALVARGDRVVCVDDLSTGRTDNVAGLLGHPRFESIVADVSVAYDVDGPVDAVLHFASAASPPDYLARPLETLAVGSEGTRHGLALAKNHGARFVLASTSEVYGDPSVHPQTENYWGNVNPVGPRSVYDEAKRFAEALTMAWQRTHGADVGIVRIFNTYGPRLRPGDGRVVSNFLTQAIEGRPLTVYGDGSQTRSLCFVSDEVAGILALLDSGRHRPREHRQSRRAHHARPGPDRARGDRFGLRDRPHALARRRPQPSAPGHHRGPPRPGLGAGGGPPRRAPANG